MQGFVVLGVRPGRIEQLAQTKVRAQERRLKNCPTPESHERRMVKAIVRAEQRPPPDRIKPGIFRSAICDGLGTLGAAPRLLASGRGIQILGLEHRSVPVRSDAAAPLTLEFSSCGLRTSRSTAYRPLGH